MIALYVVLFILDFLNELSISLLFLATFLSFLFVIWFLEGEVDNLNNRIEMDVDILNKRISALNEHRTYAFRHCEP